jgi:hypothetical protein
MPCNRAVSITKAAVTNEELLRLLSEPVVEQVVTAYLQAKYEQHRPTLVNRYSGTLVFRVGGLYVTIQGGAVSVRAYGQEALAEQLAAELQTLLAQAADRLFQQQVGRALSLFGPVNTQVVEVESEGTVQRAAVFTLNL